MLFDQEGISIQKGFQRLESLSPRMHSDTEARFETQAGLLRISFLRGGMIRMQIETIYEPDYNLLVKVPDLLPLHVNEKNACYQITSEDLTLELFYAPLRFRLLKNDHLLLASSNDRTINGELRIAPFACGNKEWLLSIALHSGEPIYGLGEKFGRLNHRGELISSWNRDATGVNAELSYKNIPFLWSPEGWGLFIHTPSPITHGVGYSRWSHRSYILKLHDPNIDLFLFTGSTPAEMILSYTLLTGRAPLLPRWSYGVWISRAYYRTAEETLEVAQKLREHQIPCDVILLDGRAWHKMDTRFDFQWDPERYPDPPAFVQKLKELNIRLCLWEYPYVSIRNPLFNDLAERGFFLRTVNGSPYLYKWFPEPFDSFVPHLMPSGIIDFTNPLAYEWYQDQHRKLFDMGVSVMKTDYGEAVPEDAVASNGDTGKRLHNVYALLYNRCVYEATQKYSQDGALVWGRAGWTGTQCYPIVWGGDPQCDWEGLAASIRGGLSSGMSGIPFYTHDIGGFATGIPDAELYVRWMQAGVFSSHTRFHGTGPREPWIYGEEVEEIVRFWLGLRYQLIPYIEACALEASSSGLPVMRSMVLEFPLDPIAWSFEEQYMFGPSLLIAPIIRPGGRGKIYLPSGNWFDFWTKEFIEGPRLIIKTMPLDKMPVYAKLGTILPMGKSAQHTDTLSEENNVKKIFFFGKPIIGFKMAGQTIQVQKISQGTLIKGINQDTEVIVWGDVQNHKIVGNDLLFP
jgi:alpha-D-xyloside xylohydrolase